MNEANVKACCPLANTARCKSNALSGEPLNGHRQIVNPQTNVIQKFLLATLPKLFPHVRVDNGVKTTWVARDAQVVRAYVEDPLVHRQISAGLAAWILKEGAQTVAQASAWTMPTLLLYAGQDQLVLPQASAEFARLAPSDVLQSHCFNVMYHEIFNDPEKAMVLAKLLAWLDNRYAL